MEKSFNKKLKQKLFETIRKVITLHFSALLINFF